MGATATTHVKRCLRAAQPGAIPTPAPAPDFERHRRKCAICHHPDREAIEELFIGWHSADSIQCLFKLPDWSTMYRHARAAGLYERRRHNIRAVLDLLLEGADSAQPSPMGIVAAVRAYACLTDSGAWVEPTKRLLLTSTHVSSNPAPLPAASADTTPPGGAALGSPAPARQAKGARGTGSLRPERSRMDQPVHSTPAAPRQHPAPAPEATDKSREAPDLQSSNLRPQTSSTSNRQSPELEMPVSHSKQRIGPLSNRQIPPHAQRELPLPQKGADKVPKR